MFLCYEIKGIQKFIFAVPKLKCVIGGSGMIARFDEKAQELAPREWIFSGGGLGAFGCADEVAARQLAEQLIQRAHKLGLDIRIGMDRSLSRAAQHADRLHPYRPPNIVGHPCGLSGLWPVAHGQGEGRRGDVHPLIQQRIQTAQQDYLGKQVLEWLQDRPAIPAELAGRTLLFFKNVSPDPDDYPDERAEAVAARSALGNRNRWAVIALDGNDMGRQYQAFEKTAQGEQTEQGSGVSDTQLREWLKDMSGELASCTREAFLTALQEVLHAWAADTEETDRQRNEQPFKSCTIPGTGEVVLPFRPLILGGDDVVLLCHSGYALQFVEAMARHFAQLSRAAAEHASMPLWPATGGRLTISGGILFSKVTFPLHMAIPYAESLLGNAKARYRAAHGDGEPIPAAVDWDVVTDSLLDTPAARRNRELRFHDQELGREVRLTRRPYVLVADGRHPDLSELRKLAEKLRGIAPSVRSRILPALQGNWSDRLAFVASLAKQHKLLMDMLWEGGKSLGSQWTVAESHQETGLPDALLLLEEDHRRARPTVPEEVSW